MRNFLTKSVQCYKLLVIFQLLISRMQNLSTNSSSYSIIILTLSRIVCSYPFQSVWWLLPLKFFDFSNTSSNPYNTNSKEAAANKIMGT